MESGKEAELAAQLGIASTAFEESSKDGSLVDERIDDLSLVV
jgi:hypothetical protein